MLTIIGVADKVKTTNNLMTWADTTTKKRMCVILMNCFVRNTVFLLILYLTNLSRCQYYATEVFSVGSD